MEPTVRELKPMGYGGILDQTFELYRQNFVLFAGIVALVQIPLALMQTVLVGNLFPWMPDLISPSSFITDSFVPFDTD